MQNDLYRIIDANINRASEALRVIEEWARFSKDSRVLTEKLKKIRPPCGRRDITLPTREYCFFFDLENFANPFITSRRERS